LGFGTNKKEKFFSPVKKNLPKGKKNLRKEFFWEHPRESPKLVLNGECPKKRKGLKKKKHRGIKEILNPQA